MCKQKLAVNLIMIVYVIAAIGCGGHGNKAVKEEMKQEPRVMEVSIGGMFCTGCEQTIQKRVGDLDGIQSVKASFTAGNAIIQFFPDKVDSIKIKEVIEGSGYSVKKFIIP
jgi:copper chaperone CopZ